MDNYPLRLYGEGLKEYYFTDFDTLKEAWESEDLDTPENNEFIYDYIWDCIVEIATINKQKSPHEYPECCDFVQELMKWTDFIFDTDDVQLNDYDLYKGWEYQTRIYIHPLSNVPYGLTAQRGSYGELDWAITDFGEMVEKQRTETYYAFVEEEK